MPVDHLPPCIRPFAERIRAFALTDGALLLILAMECFVRGVAYLQDTPPGHPAERFFPLTVWAVIWVVVGVLCLATARWHDTAPAAFATALAVGLNLVWAASLLTANLTNHGPSNAWGGGAAYLAVALGTLWTVWRSNRAEVKLREVMVDD